MKRTIFALSLFCFLLCLIPFAGDADGIRANVGIDPRVPSKADRDAGNVTDGVAWRTKLDVPTHAESAASTTALGLGNMASQSASNVAITGGSITGADVDANTLIVASGAGTVSYKIKTVSGVTGATEGDTVSIAHGLPQSTLRGATVLVKRSYPPQFMAVAESEYSANLDSTNVNVYLSSTNSGNILNASFTAVIIYEP